MSAEMSPFEIKRLITEFIQELGRLRDEKALAKGELDAMEEQLKASERWQTHSAILQEAKNQESEVTERVRELGIKYYELTGKKAAHEAIKVRVLVKLDYDHKEAEEWSRENLPEAFKFDSKTFEDYAKAVKDIKPVPWVKFIEKPQSTISKDLSAYKPNESDLVN
jgi:hypothetical protein